MDCQYEQSLSAMRDEFESTFDGKVLKLESSQLQRIYDNQKRDAVLLFLRKGVGLLYDGTDTPDDIFDFFNDNREPIVKELDDSNFEHLTQASTGSTTGDWLIQFYDQQCIDCNRLAATWETVGAKLKMRLNVAKVNRATKGILTAKRFKVEQVPEVIFLRAGKYYRYNLKNQDIESFVGFATSWYNRVTAEKVATPASPFESLVELIVEKLKAVPNWQDVVMVFAIAFVLLLILFIICKPKSQTAPESSLPVKKTSKKEK